MRLTTKGRYAVTAMLDLAMHHDAGPAGLADIAERQGISLYLEQCSRSCAWARDQHTGSGWGYHRPSRANNRGV